MEIVLVVLFITTMVVVTILKNRLTDGTKALISVIAGIALLVWFWGFEDGPIRWKILVSVVVAVSMLMLLLMKKKPAADNPAE